MSKKEKEEPKEEPKEKPEEKPEEKPVPTEPIKLMGEPKPTPAPKPQDDQIFKSFEDLGKHLASLSDKVDKLLPKEPPKEAPPEVPKYKIFDELDIF